jgi:hypothetical protein
MDLRRQAETGEGESLDRQEVDTEDVPFRAPLTVLSCIQPTIEMVQIRLDNFMASPFDRVAMLMWRVDRPSPHTS